MPIEKAIEAMRFYKAKLYNGIFNQFIAAFDVAISALEKQIPKKPILTETKCFDGSTADVVFVCPVCNRKICSDPADDIMASFLKEECPHCNCGQALDWSDTECKS